jgi:hypothetical protein
VSELRFYLDENVPTEVGRQLRSSGIDAVTAPDLGSLGAGDRDHLERATAQARILCTHDQDFLRLAAEGTEHAGIAFSPQTRVSIGGWVRELRALRIRFDAEQPRRAGPPRLLGSDRAAEPPYNVTKGPPHRMMPHKRAISLAPERWNSSTIFG